MLGLTRAFELGGMVDALRKGLMEMADVASLAFQNAGKSFGFLDDGRDLVRVAGGEDAPVVPLPDLRINFEVQHGLRD